jgi:DNA-binding transcriptional MerR regulator
MPNIYLVKDLAQISGLSIDTVKYYLKLGLIKEVERSPNTNIRYFDDTTVTQLDRIINMRRHNTPIKKIKEVLNTVK